MKKPYMPMFPEYLQILTMLDPKEVIPILTAMSDYCLDGIEFDLEQFSPMGQMALLGMKPGLDKSREIQKVRSDAGQKGGSAGKGTSKNIGNDNARKNNSKTITNNSKSIAKQKQINSKTIANNSKTIAKQSEGEEEGEGEGEGDRSKRDLLSAREASSTKLSFTECLKKALEFRMDCEPVGTYREVVRQIYASMTVDGFLRDGITDWYRHLMMAINQLRQNGETGIQSPEEDFSSSDESDFA